MFVFANRFLLAYETVLTSTHNLFSVLKRGTTGAVAEYPRSSLTHKIKPDEAVPTSTYNLFTMLKRGTTGAIAGDPSSTLTHKIMCFRYQRSVSNGYSQYDFIEKWSFFQWCASSSDVVVFWISLIFEKKTHMRTGRYRHPHGTIL